MKIDLLRPDDLLNLRIETTNLRLESNDLNIPSLVVEDHHKPAYMAVIFPPQTIAEGAYFESSDIEPADAGSKRTDIDKGNDISESLDMPGQPSPPRITNALLGRPSRLIFQVPPDAHIPFSLEGLIDWSKMKLSVSPIAGIGPEPTTDEIESAPDITPPSPYDTAIEMPYGLVVSPNRDVTFEQRLLPFTSRGRTELWHTRLVTKTDTGTSEISLEKPAHLRAIWSPDYKPNNVPLPATKNPYLSRTAMSANDRHQIVVLTSAFHGYEVDLELPFFLTANTLDSTREIVFTKLPKFKITMPYIPQPFEAEQFILSPLGGWLHSRGHWTPPRVSPVIVHRKPRVQDLLEVLNFTNSQNIAGSPSPVLMGEMSAVGSPLNYQLDLSEWVHIATEGRDHYVRIVYEGELWPFRHRASLIKVTERKFKKNGSIVAAYLMQHMYIVVREPEKEFNHRGNPLQRVRLTTLVTPDIAEPEPFDETNRSFWIKVRKGGATEPDFFDFHAVATDISGDLSNFALPLMFVSLSDLPEVNPAATKIVAQEYNKIEAVEFRNAKFFGQKLTFAQPNTSPTKSAKNTQLVTQLLSFVVDQMGNSPQLLKAEVKIPQIQELLGTKALTTIRYSNNYVKSGFDLAAGVFAEIVKEDPSNFKPDDPLSLMVPDNLKVTFSSDKAGGIATPNMGISIISREFGPLAGKIEDAINNKFDPAEFFAGVTAQLFGTFDLFELIPGDSTSIDKNAPKLITTSEDDGSGNKQLITALNWEPNIVDLDLGIAAFKKDQFGTSNLSIHSTIKKPVSLNGSLDDVIYDFTGSLDHFQVSVLKSVYINFSEFSFSSSSGKKTDVKVKLDEGTPLEFGGDLKFVEEMRKAIPPGLFGEGPSLDLIYDPPGIRAGFASSLPPVSVGVFNLKDVCLGASLTLPFLDGKPVLNFNISERPHPFLLTVSIFGGGGFFALQLDTAGIKELQAALEFGAAAALDIGVASGEVHIMAGIYISLQRKETSTDLMAVLSGYLRMGGSLRVLALIKVSVEFNLSFTYDSARDKAYGRATLTVSVEVAFFSKSVELTVERAFGGSGDPTFGDLFSKPEMWSEYSLAFAGG
jgi:hypothetical protein